MNMQLCLCGQLFIYCLKLQFHFYNREAFECTSCFVTGSFCCKFLHLFDHLLDIPDIMFISSESSALREHLLFSNFTVF